CAAALSYAFSFQGVEGALIDSPWKLFAAVLGFSIASGLAYPYLRGVRKGDALATSMARRRQHPAGTVFAFTETVFATALENGFKGRKIKVRLPDGRRGEGIIRGYAGTLSPASLELTEAEA
ncbi:MAG: hypothetical protein AB1626_02775, partial [Candidatus Micrarchaeota archaeon]